PQSAGVSAGGRGRNRAARSWPRRPPAPEWRHKSSSGGVRCSAGLFETQYHPFWLVIANLLARKKPQQRRFSPLGESQGGVPIKEMADQRAVALDLRPGKAMDRGLVNGGPEGVQDHMELLLRHIERTHAPASGLGVVGAG